MYFFCFFFLCNWIQHLLIDRKNIFFWKKKLYLFTHRPFKFEYIFCSDVTKASQKTLKEKKRIFVQKKVINKAIFVLYLTLLDIFFCKYFITLALITEKNNDILCNYFLTAYIFILNKSKYMKNKFKG